MSRVGKQPVTIPAGVTANIGNGEILVSGPKGKLTYRWGQGVKVLSEGGTVTVLVEGESKQSRANFGTTRAHINNMVLGVTKGWKKSLEMSGVGFNAKLAGQIIVLSVGFSHEVKLPIPSGVKCTITKNVIDLESSDKETLGIFAATIRAVKKPEPYLGKGIKYSDEVVRRKAGKTGKK